MRRGLGLFALACATLGLALTHGARAGEAARVSDAAVREAGFPAKLSDFGFFADGPRQQPAARVMPYALDTPLWSDGADKLRFIYLPAGTQLAADGEGLLQFPIGAAIIKTFAFGEGAARRLIETRVLLHRTDGWVALPYRWNAEQTEATLALTGGRIDLVTPAGEAISYAIPNKNQCKTCHSSSNKVVPIGPKARNLTTAWLGQMVKAGALDRVPDGAGILPDWRTHASGPAAPLARAYLDVNCAHCRTPEGRPTPGSICAGSRMTLRRSASASARSRQGAGRGNTSIRSSPGTRTNRSCSTGWPAPNPASPCPNSARRASTRMAWPWCGAGLRR